MEGGGCEKDGDFWEVFKGLQSRGRVLRFWVQADTGVTPWGCGGVIREARDGVKGRGLGDWWEDREGGGVSWDQGRLPS